MWNRTLSKFERLKVFSIRNEQRRLYTSFLCVKSNIIKIRTFESIQHSKWTTKTLCKFFACEIEHYQNSNVWKYSAFEINKEHFIQVSIYQNKQNFCVCEIEHYQNSNVWKYSAFEINKEHFIQVSIYQNEQNFCVCEIEHYQNSNIWKYTALEINKEDFIQVSIY